MRSTHAAPCCWQVTLSGPAAVHHNKCLSCRFDACTRSSYLASEANAYRARRPLRCRCAVADVLAFETGATQPVKISDTSDVPERRAPPRRHIYRYAGAQPVRESGIVDVLERQAPPQRHVYRYTGARPSVQPPPAQQKQTRPVGSKGDPSRRQPRAGDIQQVKSRLDVSLQRKDTGMCHQALQALESAVAASGPDELFSAISKQEQQSLFSHIQHTARLTDEPLEPIDSAGLVSDTCCNQAKGASAWKKTQPSQHAVKATLVKYCKSLNTFGKVSVVLGSSRMTILKLFLSHRQDWAEDFLLKLPANLPCTSYQSFISACAEHDNYTALKIVMKSLAGTSCWLSKSATLKAMTVCEAANDVDAALTLFELAAQKGKAVSEVFSKAITACLGAGRPKEAFIILDRLKASGLELSLHSYHTAFTCSAHLKAQGVQDLYAQMMAQDNLVLKDKTFGFVLRAAAQCGGEMPASWSIQVLSDMNDRCIQINSHIFAAFLQAITAVPLHSDQLEAVFEAMADYRACQAPSAFVYSSLLTFCAKQAPERALDVWHALQEDGLPLTSYLFSTMFAACAAAGTPEMLEAADSSHMQLEGLWNKICSKGKTASQERDMLRAHNALLHVYASHGQTHKAKQLYASMQERGPAIDRISASTVIAAFAKSADKKAAMQVFDQMRAQKMQPSSQCYTSLLAACARAGDLAAARRVFSDMHVAPTVEAYTALMDACLKQDSPDVGASAAFEVFAEMKAKGLKPTATTYGCLLMVCARCNAVDHAFQLYEEAYAAGALEGDECHNILVGICSDAGRVDDALNLVKSLASKHGAMQQTTLNSLIRSLLNVNQAPRALRMLSIMLNMGLRPYRTTIDALIAGCAQNSNSVEAARFYWGLREQGGEASKASSSDLIISLCKAGDRLGALKVYQDMTFTPAPHPPPHIRPSHPVRVSKGKSNQQQGKQQGQAQTQVQAATTAGDRGYSLADGVATARNASATAVNCVDDALEAGAATAIEAPATAGFGTITTLNMGIADTTRGSSCGTDQPLTRDSGTAPGSADTKADRLSSSADSLSSRNDASTELPNTQPSQRLQPLAAVQMDDPHADAASSSQAGAAMEAIPLPAKAHAPKQATSKNRSNSKPSQQSKANGLMQRPARRPPQEVRTTQDQAHPDTMAASNSKSHFNSRHSRHSMSSAVASGSQSTESEPSHSSQPQPILHRPPSLLGRTVEATAVAAGLGSGGGRLTSSLRLSQKGAPVFPSIAATAALVHAFASADELEQCQRLYKQLQRDKKGLPGLTHSHRKTWESVIEAACRAGNTEWALQVFDDWKAYSMSSMFVLQPPQDQPVKFPHLSNATLAFLESCCRSSPQHEWRVFDVCAVMRQQYERKQEAALARPAKLSHHFAEHSGSQHSQV